MGTFRTQIGLTLVKAKKRGELCTKSLRLRYGSQFLLTRLMRGPSGEILLGRLPPFVGRASIRIPTMLKHWLGTVQRENSSYVTQ